jgi:hypothetical protein
MPSKPKNRRTPPARPEPKVDPERAHDDAIRVLRAEYYGGVRGITEDLKARVASGEIASEDALNDAVHQEIDGSYWVIYTHANFQVLLCSDHHDASFEEYGEVPLAADGNVNWAALAFATLERDVRDQMDAEDVRVVEERRRVREYPARAKPGNWGPGIWIPSEARPRPTLRGTRRPVARDRRRPGRK